MLQFSEKMRDLMGFGALLIFFAVFLLIPHEIPKEIQGDFPADVYPRTLLLAGLVLLILQVARVLMQGAGETLSLGSERLLRTAALFGIMLGGYLIILASGFILAGGYFVFCYAWLLKERNRAAIIATVATPTLVYWCLEYAFRIRLPSILDAF